MYSGIVESVTNEGNFVVKAEFTPDVNDPVYGPDGSKIGKVKRVFGPVDSPYVTIVPENKDVLAKIGGKKITFRRDAKDGKGKRRH